METLSENQCLCCVHSPNQSVQESEVHIMQEIEAMDEEEKACLRAHVVRIVAEALRDDIHHELQNCADEVRY